MYIFTSQELNDLWYLCDWLSDQPCQSAFTNEIAAALPSARYWISFNWKDRRKQAAAIYYQVGYGWRLNKAWKRNIEKLMSHQNA